MDMYIGQIVMFGGNFAIQDYAFCDGQTLAISQFNALFAILGTTYGGNGSTNFALPDMRGRAAVHAGSGPGLPPVQLGRAYGVETVSLNQTHLPQHTHGATFTPSGGGGGSLKATTQAGSSNSPDGNYLAAAKVSGGADVNAYRANPLGGTLVDLAGLSITGGDGNVTIQPAGGSQGFEVAGPRIAVNFEILINGLFPPRN